MASASQKGRLESLSSTCKSMMDLVEELDALDRRIYHLKSEIDSLSHEQTDMGTFLRRGRNIPSMLEGVSAAQKPFHGLPRLQQFDMMKKVMFLRTDMSVKFEALRQAQMAVEKMNVITESTKCLETRAPPGGSYLPEDDVVEGEYLLNLVIDNADLAGKILGVEEKRIAMALDNLDGKTKITELLSKCKTEFEQYQDGALEDEDQENDTSNANSSPEVKALDKKRYQLNKVEKRVVQMKTIIQKLMFSLPNAGRGENEEVNEKHQKMMFFCGKSLDGMRAEL